MFWIGLLGGLALAGAWVLSKCYFRVDEGHLAVLTTFGAAETVGGDPARLRTWAPGSTASARGSTPSRCP